MLAEHGYNPAIFQCSATSDVPQKNQRVVTLVLYTENPEGKKGKKWATKNQDPTTEFLDTGSEHGNLPTTHTDEKAKGTCAFTRLI